MLHEELNSKNIESKNLRGRTVFQGYYDSIYQFDDQMVLHFPWKGAWNLKMWCDIVQQRVKCNYTIL